ncbi:MAG TPA: phosphoribosylformylglycinamidine synthase subunit PurL [Longimicrobiales bacterium]|nr:phosphoribosylformylglycinamidine synthase subunit PurL [Longimicrobiales bacterium]
MTTTVAPAPFPGDPPITPELVAEHGLTPEEYDLIVGAIGREPTYTELGVFSALWSEHCGYKNSRPLLRQLPTRAPWVLQGPGENAGVIDIGDGYAVAFKIESHNHPSAVEPYQGAATGVGGILRDVFTMGARPVAVLDSLRFGPLTSPRVRYLFAGVVKGIGDYGNCVGIPNIGGEVYFDEAYEGNPLVNAMAIGLMRTDQLIRGEASGPGNPIIAVGARTGRDGIHGATFASEELSEDTESRRPQVQVGDPFTEKLLLEASLELIRSGFIVGIQDMGAAGLASSSTEMAARAGTGVDIDTALVPTREPGMTPYEILLSETQERMLVVARAGHEDDVRRILEKWELEAAVIGRVTDDGMYRVRHGGQVVCEVPGEPLVNGCPTYVREAREADDVVLLRQWQPSAAELTDADATGSLLRLLGSPNIASRRWIYRQYDTTVRTSTVIGPGGDAGVLRVRGSRKGIAATVDCNGRYVYLEPRRGAMIAVAEAARNLVCVGARPRAVTDNLNFGNPLKPEVYYQLREAVLGIADACLAFDTPVVSGNVSLYNENPAGAIFPTPVIGMVGVLDDVERHVRMAFREPGDVVVLLGANTAELGGSEYLRLIHGKLAGEPPAIDLARERALQETVLELAAAGVLRSAHDCAEGGLAVCLAESAIADPERPLGVDVELRDDLPIPALLFGEAQGRIVVTCDAGHVPTILETARRHGVPASEIGRVGEPCGRFRIRTATGAVVEAQVADLAERYHSALPLAMDGDDAGFDND